MRLRSLLRVNPLDGEALEAALESAADAVLLPLNDAALGEPLPLRDAAREALPRIQDRGKAALLVANHPRTRLLRDDLEATVGPHLDGVLLAHAVEPQDVRDLAVLLREFEYGRDIEPGTVLAYPVIDTARGLLAAAAIASAVPRFGGLVLDADAYALDAGARREDSGARLAYARGAVVAATRALGGQPILMQAEAFDVTMLGHYGFAGLVIHEPRNAIAVNAAMTPTAAEVAHARAAVEAYAAARAEGAWVARLGARVIDAATARAAQALVDAASG